MFAWRCLVWSREPGTLADHQPGPKKQQDLRESWIILSEEKEDPELIALSLFVASFVLSDSNKTQNSSQAAANKLAALS